MATRSSIAIQNENGTVEAIYCHWDGYPEHNGKILKEHYTDEERIRELISNGDMSSLDVLVNPTTSTHCFDVSEDGVCVFYGRDRGESGTEPRTYKNKKAWIEAIGQQYNYLFNTKTGKWRIYR